MSYNQDREQWTDGANAFCLSPGKIIIYDRNRDTLKELKECDYKIIPSTNFPESILSTSEMIKEKGLEYMNSIQENLTEVLNKEEKVAITIESGELSRGRGGPRCLTMPINRIK